MSVQKYFPEPKAGAHECCVSPYWTLTQAMRDLLHTSLCTVACPAIYLYGHISEACFELCVQNMATAHTRYILRPVYIIIYASKIVILLYHQLLYHQFLPPFAVNQCSCKKNHVPYSRYFSQNGILSCITAF